LDVSLFKNDSLGLFPFDRISSRQGQTAFVLDFWPERHQQKKAFSGGGALKRPFGLLMSVFSGPPRSPIHNDGYFYFIAQAQVNRENGDEQTGFFLFHKYIFSSVLWRLSS